MTIFYVTTGAWGTGTGTPNTAAQVDGNFYDVDQRIVSLNAELADGKMIESVTYTQNSFTLHFTDGTTQVIPLPIATLQFVGEWMNSSVYVRGNMFSASGYGIFQVLVDHTSPPPPAPFDPNAVDGSSNPLYQLWMPLRDTNYDAAIFVPGSVQRSPGELMYQGIANRPMQLPAGNANCFGYLDVAGGTTAIILAIEKNSVGVGTITFAAGSGHSGVFSIAANVDFVEGDRYALRATQSDNAGPSGMSITLPFVRKDV